LVIDNHRARQWCLKNNRKLINQIRISVPGAFGTVFIPFSAATNLFSFFLILLSLHLQHFLSFFSYSTIALFFSLLAFKILFLSLFTYFTITNFLPFCIQLSFVLFLLIQHLQQLRLNERKREKESRQRIKLRKKESRSNLTSAAAFVFSLLWQLIASCNHLL